MLLDTLLLVTRDPVNLQQLQKIRSVSHPALPAVRHKVNSLQTYSDALRTCIAIELEPNEPIEMLAAIDTYFAKPHVTGTQQDSRPITPLPPGQSPYVPAVASPVPRNQHATPMLPSKTPGSSSVKRPLEDAEDPPHKRARPDSDLLAARPKQVADLIYATSRSDSPSIIQQEESAKIEQSQLHDEQYRHLTRAAPGKSPLLPRITSPYI
jgi:hypothetical protein